MTDSVVALCQKCPALRRGGPRLASGGRTTCSECARSANTEFRQRYRRRRAAGECVRGCGLPAEEGRSRCEGHLREAREDTAARAAQDRERARVAAWAARANGTLRTGR